MASKFSGASGALGAEAIELRICLLHFGCASEEFRVVVANLTNWMDKSSPSWAAYRDLMECHLVTLDKRPGVRPVGIGYNLCHAIAKLFMRGSGDQAKTACGSFQLFGDLEAVI